MKTGGKRTKKAPIIEEPQAETQSSPFLQPPADPLAAEVCQMNLLYLGFAGGVLTTAPDSLQSMNIEMWPIEQIYKLRSDLISLCLTIDVEDQSIQESLKTGFELVVSELQENENEEPLRFQRLPISSQQRKPSKEIRFDGLTRPCSPMPTIQPAQLYSHTRARVEQISRSRPASTHVRRTISTTALKSMTQDTLWENVDLFLRPIEKISSVTSYLTPSKTKVDTTVLTEPIGPHYSTTLCRAPNILADPVKSRLIIPPPPADLTGNTDASSYLHSRLISAVVPLIGSSEHLSSQNSHQQINSNSTSLQQQQQQQQTNSKKQLHDERNSTASCGSTTNVLNDLKGAEYNATPTAECVGFTGYAWLNFEERLAMELAYVGIEGSAGVVTSVDCPIAQDLAEAIKEQEAAIKEANKWKKIMADLVQKRRPKIEERNKKLKEWNSALDHYYSQEKAKQQQDKKKGRPGHSASTESD